MKKIKLPEPSLKGRLSLEEAISLRRSVREYFSEKLTMGQIPQLLWAAQGITEKRYGLRAIPSAGATYPLEIFVVIEDGVFKYINTDNSLEGIINEDRRQRLSSAALGQHFIEQAPLNIVITAIYKRTSGRYGDRAERYIHIEAGHCAQNIHLQAVALGLDSVPVGAFYDKQVQSSLDLPVECQPLYIIPVGKARR